MRGRGRGESRGGRGEGRGGSARGERGGRGGASNAVGGRGGRGAVGGRGVGRGGRGTERGRGREGGRGREAGRGRGGVRGGRGDRGGRGGQDHATKTQAADVGSKIAERKQQKVGEEDEAGDVRMASAWESPTVTGARSAVTMRLGLRVTSQYGLLCVV